MARFIYRPHRDRRTRHDRFRVGQRVAAVTVTGSYATRRNVEARWLVPAPEQADSSKLVAAILNGLNVIASPDGPVKRHPFE